MYNRRISYEAFKEVREWGAIYLQFPTFTYIKITGFLGVPSKLPWSPTDKWVMLELVRQLLDYHKIQNKRHKAGFLFPISIGRYTCANIYKAKNVDGEMSKVTLQTFHPITNFDYWGKFSETRLVSSHIPHLEDIWFHCQDEIIIRQW